MSDLCPVYAPFFGAMGCTSAIVFTCIGASYGTAKSGVGISAMAVLRPDLMMKNVVPVIMAGIIAIYGLVVSVLISGNLEAKMSLYQGFVQLGAGLSVGLAGLAAGFAIGIVGDAGVRGTAQQPRLFVGMILILIFAEVLGLYGLIVALIMNTRASSSGVTVIHSTLALLSSSIPDMSSWSDGSNRSTGSSPTLVGSPSPTFPSQPATSNYRRRSTSYSSNASNAGRRYSESASPSMQDAAAVAAHDASKTFNLFRVRRGVIRRVRDPGPAAKSCRGFQLTAYLHETVEVPGLLSETRVSRFRDDEYADRDGECVGESSRMARSYDSYDRGINNYVRGANLRDLQTDEYVERGDGRIMGLGESSRADQRVGNEDRYNYGVYADAQDDGQSAQGSQDIGIGATQRGWRGHDYRYEGQTSNRRAGSFSRGD
ncbi:hypothetical protein EVG20_g1744 [Dentipellis fragilis]|uniref:V-type proton ATPase proteolipid subunit n=1 Tax=Dentipellis fragilis TaxID=205917 RepID=A0A4Y9Z9W9_9AGAM|nr:hypothetical protein EVG20_g1744 [Dentipellis fragilis]